MNTKRLYLWGGLAVFVIIIGIFFYYAVSAKNHVDAIALSVPVTSADWTRGPSNPQVTLVEYSDFQCPACGAYFPLVERLVQESSTTLRFVYRHFPLITIHPNASSAALASEAAGKQGKFWEMYELLFTNQKEWSELPDPSAFYVKYAKSLGLNTTQFVNDMTSHDVEKAVLDDIKSGNEMGLNSTPSFFINGVRIENPQSYEAFKALLTATSTTTS